MNRDAARAVRERARDRCEYCLVAAADLPLPFQIDHIIAEKHRGPTELANLALACPHCNRHKGPNIAGVDPQTEQLVRLFHPRTDHWPDHFRLEGEFIIGKTAVGRATVQVLAMNDDGPLLLRRHLPEGWSQSKR